MITNMCGGRWAERTRCWMTLIMNRWRCARDGWETRCHWCHTASLVRRRRGIGRSVCWTRFESITMFRVNVIDESPTFVDFLDGRIVIADAECRFFARVRRDLAENQMDFGQSHTVLVRTIIETIMTIIVINTGRLGETIKKTERKPRKCWEKKHDKDDKAYLKRYSKPFRCRWSSLTGKRILSAAVKAISVQILNDEFVSMKVINLIPRRSPILCTNARRLWVIVRHGLA